jgi:hypothetical protein
MRQFVMVAMLILALPLLAADAPEAAKVAAWVRALPAVDPDASYFGALGALSTNHIGPATDTIRSVGPAGFYANASAVAQAKSAIAGRASYLRALTAGSIFWLRDVQNLPWGLVEVARGAYRYDLIDAIVLQAQASGARYVGTVMPYAGWELRAAGYAPTTDEQCLRLFDEDFFYLKFDQRMDRYRDEAQWLAYLQRVVERYDGDGIDDMPGLTAPVRYWQIHNEPEGERCGLFRDDAAAFVQLMRKSSEVVHLACASCQVVNGGAAFPFVRENQVPPLRGATFWRDYSAAGGAAFVDVIAVHYNQGKDADHGNVADFEVQIARARELLGAKPVWVTEFGVIVGDRGNFKGLTEVEAGAWYVRMYAAGLTGGAVRFISDAPGFIESDGTTYLPFYVQKLVQAKLGGFMSATKLAAGQYKFRVGSSDVYVLWTGLPAGLTGTATIADLYGNESTVDLTTARLTFSESAPLIVTKGGVAMRRRASRR